MLTPEMIEQANKVTGWNVPTTPGGKPSRADEILKLGKEAEERQRKESRSISEKVLDFTGGKELSQGLGQALTQRRNAKLLEDIQKNQMDIQSQILQRIKEKKSNGEDTSHLEKTLQDLDLQIATTGDSAGEDFLNPNDLSNKEVLGDALQLATTAGGAKVAGAVAGNATKATGVLKGIAQGAKTGALGGSTVGGLTGVSQGLQDEQDATGIAKSGLKGAAIGAAGGAVVGGVTGGISGGIRGIKAGKANTHIDAITPKVNDMTPTQYQDLLNQGKIQPKTATQPAKYILSPEEIDTAERYKDLLKTKDPVKNIINVSDQIKNHDEDVGKFLRKNNGIFNSGELKNNILKGIEDVNDITVDDVRLNAKKQQMVDNFIESLEKNDMESLWEARKKYDKQIEKAFTGSPSLQNNLKREFRNSIQDFIADRTPDTTYKDSMKEMSKLFRLKDTLLQKATNERKLGALQKWAKDNEGTIKLLGGIGAIGTALGLGTQLVKAAEK